MSYTTIQIQFHLPVDGHPQPSLPKCTPSWQPDPIDFLHRLPCELVPEILQHFPMQALFECMDVSRTWRARIQNSPSLWHEISVMKDDDQLIPRLSAVEQYIRSYHTYYASEKSLGATLGLIHSGRLNQLKTLAIHEEQGGAHFTGDDVLRTLQLLPLTELTLIHSGQKTSDWPLWPAIVSACPHLERLRVDMPCTDSVFDGDSMPRSSKLTHLSWSGGPTITPLEIENVLDACPRLIFLKLTGCQGVLPLLSIYQQCPPTLRYLGLNAGKCDEFDAWWDAPPAAPPGLRALAVACLPQNWLDLCQIVWAGSIQDLTVFHDDTRFDAGSLLRLYRGQHLRLRQTRQMYQYQSAIRARVHVGNRTQEVSSTFCRSYAEQCPWFIASLRSAIDPQQTLLELECTQCFMDTSLLPWLEHLLPCVRELHTINCVMESAALAGLVAGLGAMKHPMHHVRFSSIPGLTDSLVHQLAAIDGLQHVTLSYCDAVTDEGVRYLVDHSVHLEELDIRGCKWVTDETESYVQQKLEYRHHHHLPLF